jgi:hypothetical protein
MMPPAGTAEDRGGRLGDVLVVGATRVQVPVLNATKPGHAAQGNRDRAEDGSAHADTSEGGCNHAHTELDAALVPEVYLGVRLGLLSRVAHVRAASATALIVAGVCA